MFNNGYYITAELRVKDNNRLEEAKTELNKLCKASVTEPGCTIFQAHQDSEKESTFLLWERFENEQAFKDHFEQQHTKQFVAKELTEIIKFNQSDVI
ncbi:putative quinol monooxygenase [Litoribacillus peritrichatus]|uniref:ABM domain-containing protein n=1 Tax=Litoribacillus peritrichatus TaxID=718191 RepID=A0ABP7MAH5_9GAMM